MHIWTSSSSEYHSNFYKKKDFFYFSKKSKPLFHHCHHSSYINKLLLYFCSAVQKIIIPKMPQLFSWQFHHYDLLHFNKAVVSGALHCLCLTNRFVSFPVHLTNYIFFLFSFFSISIALFFLLIPIIIFYCTLSSSNSWVDRESLRVWFNSQLSWSPL